MSCGTSQEKGNWHLLHFRYAEPYHVDIVLSPLCIALVLASNFSPSPLCDCESLRGRLSLFVCVDAQSSKVMVILSVWVKGNWTSFIGSWRCFTHPKGFFSIQLMGSLRHAENSLRKPNPELKLCSHFTSKTHMTLFSSNTENTSFGSFLTFVWVTVMCRPAAWDHYQRR